MGVGPSDSWIWGLLKDLGYTSDEIRQGHHDANEDTQSEGWLTQRAINKWVEKYPS